MNLFVIDGRDFEVVGGVGSVKRKSYYYYHYYLKWLILCICQKYMLFPIF